MIIGVGSIIRIYIYRLWKFSGGLLAISVRPCQWFRSNGATVKDDAK